jgi:hypothetical protein
VGALRPTTWYWRMIPATVIYNLEKGQWIVRIGTGRAGSDPDAMAPSFQSIHFSQLHFPGTHQSLRWLATNDTLNSKYMIRKQNIIVTDLACSSFSSLRQSFFSSSKHGKWKWFRLWSDFSHKGLEYENVRIVYENSPWNIEIVVFPPIEGLSGARR